MAKNNINLGTLSGKLGDNVFWRTHGQQRVRTYFKREEYSTNYEQALRQSQFANLKSIYQWLPEPFRKACNLYHTGGNCYADFMRQYPNYTMGRDKAGFGAGRFLPVPCAVSNGTLSSGIKAYITNVKDIEGTAVDPVTKGIVIETSDYSERDGDWSSIQDYIKASHAWIREGDIMHVVLSWVHYNETDWGEPYAVDGFPFAYERQLYARLPFDKDIEDNIPDLTGGQFNCGYDDMREPMRFALAIPASQLSINDAGDTSVVGAIVVERPTNTRQRRWSKATLLYDRSQLDILNSQTRSRWNEYAAQSYMRTT